MVSLNIGNLPKENRMAMTHSFEKEFSKIILSALICTDY